MTAARCALVLLGAGVVGCEQTPLCAEGSYEVVLGDKLGGTCDFEFWTGSERLQLEVSGPAKRGGHECVEAEANLSPIPTDFGNAAEIYPSALPGRGLVQSQGMSYSVEDCRLDGWLWLRSADLNGTLDEVLQRSSEIDATFVWSTQGTGCETVNPENVICTNIYEVDVRKL